MLKKLVKAFLILYMLLISLSKSQKEDYFYERIHTVRLEGSTDETVYWINIYIGSPPQRQTAIIDTGSYLLAFPCQECKTCGDHISYPYDLEKSLTAKKEKCKSTKLSCQGYCNNFSQECNWSVSYAEGSSISGYMAGDYVVLGDEMQDYIEKLTKNQISEKEEQEYLTYIKHESVFLNFGCTTNETNLFLSQVPDGIIGLAPSDKSGRANTGNIVDEIFKKHKQNNETHVFSLCLNAEKGGYMSVGGYNYELHEKNARTQIIPFDSDSGYYSVSIKQILIQNNVIVTNIGYTIIDSGTTIVLGPSRIINPIIQKINELCESEQYSCGGSKKNGDKQQSKFLYNPSKYENNVNNFFDSFPNIDFKFENGQVIVWKPSAYLYIDRKNGYKNLYQFGFEAYESGKLYLGGPFMKNYDILFDRDNQEIHFTASKCTIEGITSMHMNNNSNKVKKSIEDGTFVKDVQNFKKNIYIMQKKYTKINNDYQKNNQNNDYNNNNFKNNSNNKDNTKDQNKNLNNLVKIIWVLMVLLGVFSLVVSFYYIYRNFKKNYDPKLIQLDDQDDDLTIGNKQQNQRNNELQSSDHQQIQMQESVNNNEIQQNHLENV
ncbi:plasmepsin 5, putative [Ichthyophthirius multifiliis]|uniref:Plasmepsin 5, putative n=1 Tax=Ichthyophthirius multifiliis TaxID=5932 RepID=G0R492_ICHMU|nr:plasmepsin 5, putative [Ichthyophthirius multifiliis]EGR27703.1 plasmepsin 5, putative [Ichthyophthirius multifiliis]|eukprot:XP_004025155.1 plasmepsin 5, putative [Ichthyophthirius multifiliis]